MSKMSTCHPDRTAKARGLCRSCYGKQFEKSISEKECECGCGGNVTRGSRYLQGHYAKSDVGRAALIVRQTGKKLSEKTRTKMSEARKGRKPTPKMMARLAEWNKSGWQKNIGHKISAALRGRKASPETRARLSLAQRGRKHSPESIEKMKRVQRERFSKIEERLKLKGIQKGKKLSPETLARMSEAQKRRAREKPETFANVRAAARRNSGPSPETVKKIITSRARNNKQLSKEARANMSKAQRARAARTKPWEWGGWKGGISKTPYPPSWDTIKSDIRKRDGGICLDCGRGDFSLTILKSADVHHINGDKRDCQEENLISLCRSCHMKAQKDLENSIDRLHAILSGKYGYTYD